jgi:hypothetical protein
MKMLSKIAIIVTALVSLSTMICGFSISSQETIEASSISFHTAIGVLSVLLSFLTFALLARD